MVILTDINFNLLIKKSARLSEGAVLYNTQITEN